MQKSAQLAKLTRPRSTKLLKRKRIFTQLDALSHSACVWIAAPAGAGKTSLVASYLDSRKRKGLWYQVDQGDEDIASFFYYLSLAATSSAPKRRPFSLLLTPEYLPNLQFFIRRYFRELFQYLPSGAVVVLDNFQETSTTLAGVVDVLCDEVPEGANVLVMSRQSVPSALTRHVANGKIVTLGGEELKTQLDETRAILGQDCDEEMLRVVQARTAGWAAGVVLMREHLRGSVNPASATLAEAPSRIFDYFAGELLARLDRNAHDFLLSTSLLPNMTAALASAASGVSDAADRLEYLYVNNVFTDRRDGTTSSYQYHPLFREFLGRRLRREMSAEHLRDLLVRCARACITHGETEVAAELLIEAETWNELVPLILAHANALLNQGRWRTLQGWINRVPKLVRDEVAWLTFWLGMTHMQIDQSAAVGEFERAFAQFAAQADPIGQALTSAAAIATYFFQLDSFVGAAAWLERLEAHLDSEAVLANPSIALRATSAAALAACLSRPNFPMQAHCLAIALVELENPAVAVQDKLLPGLMLMFYCAVVGDVANGDRIYAWLKPHLREEQVPPVLRAFSANFAAYFLLLKGEDVVALELLDYALALSEREGIASSSFVATYFRLFIHAVNGRLAEVEACLPNARKYVDHTRGVIETQYTFGIGKWHLLRGEHNEAARAIVHAMEVARRTGFVYLLIVGYTALGVCRVKLQDWQGAEQALEEAWRHSTGNVYDHMRPLTLLVRSARELHRGNADVARSLAAEALDQLAKSSVLAIPRCPTFLVPEVFSLMLRESGRTELVRKLIRQLCIAPIDFDNPRWPWPIKLITLGGLRIHLDDVPAVFGRKSPKKDLALLKLLIAAGPKGLNAEQIGDALWADSDGDRAMNALTQSVHRLRTLLRDRDALHANAGVVALNRQRVWVDAWAFEALCQGSAALNGDKHLLQEHARSLLELYQGDFLPHDAELASVLTMRERLRTKFLNSVNITRRHLEQTGDAESTSNLLGRATEVDLYAEKGHWGASRQSS